MGRERKSIADLGPCGIIHEGFKIFHAHAKQLLLIQVALVLPCSLVSLACSYLSFLCQSKLLPPPPVPPALHVGFHGRGSPITPNLDLLAGSITTPTLEFIGLSLVLSLLGIAASAVTLSGNLYAVGMIYTNTNFSLVDVVRVIPRLWKRVVLTELYFLLVIFATVVCMVGVATLFIIWRLSPAWILLPSLVYIVALYYLGLIANVAESVSVLDSEQNYGWAAFRKAFNLLRGKMWVAVGCFLLLALISAPFILVLQFTIMRGGSISVVKVLVGVVVFVAELFVVQLTVLSSGVLYVSAKAYHGEDIAESLGSRGLTRNGYEAVESDPLLDDALP